MKKIKLKKLQKLPPILFPIWLIFFLIESTRKLVLWLLGYWECYNCKKQFTPFEKPFPHVYEDGNVVKKGIQYQKYRKRHVCAECNANILTEKEKAKNEGSYYYG